MNRYAWIAALALVGLVAFVLGDLLRPDSVPVAQAVELSGTAPESRPPSEGFFIVPPRVVDVRDGVDDDARLDDDSDAADPGPADADDAGEADDDLDDSDGSDDSPDDLDSPDDSFDDDD